MKLSVFDYRDYKKYIRERIKAYPGGGHGVQLKLAKSVGCQTAFVSQVLRGNPHFSLEQGIRINKFFGHTKEEGRFFLLLLEFAKAGSFDLKNHFEALIDEVINQRNHLEKRLNAPDRVPDELQHVYYSVWYYAAVHVMLSIPGLRTPEAICASLKLSREKVIHILEFLTQAGLAVVRGGQYEIGSKVLHLSRESPHIFRHHSNWRNRALISIDQNSPQDLHYSNVVTVAQKDVPLIKEEFIKAIEKFRSIVQESREETVQVLSLDFYNLMQNV